MPDHLYVGASTITGPLQPAADRVRFRRVLTRRENVGIAAMAAGQLLLTGAFITYLAWPSHLPILAGHSLTYQIAAVFGCAMIIGLQVISLLQTVSVLHFASRARDPIPMVARPGLRVAMLTTIVPSKEPWEVAERTLLAMKRQIHDGVLDVWVLDEEDNPVIRARCAELGINHFSRRGVPEWNQPEGPFRAKTKHGNHNAWRQMHEHRYDLVSQMDPDHTPLDSNDFLRRTLGYFNDPDVAFVVCPQVYDNHSAGLIAKGSAELAYLFHGVTQRGANGLGAPVLIGTNHVFRPAAWQQIDGYQDCIIEDHLTAMRVPAETNPATGRRWRGVYTPDILTAGEGPNSWTDFFSQQRRWAYGIFQIATRKSPAMFGRMTPAQRVSFASLQFFYPSVGLTWLLGNLLSALYLIGGVSGSRLGTLTWAALFVSSTVAGIGISTWLRRFNLMPHERSSYNLNGMLLNLVTTPVYLAAGFAQLTGRPLAYKVTAKGRLATGDRLSTFRLQIQWIIFAVVSVLIGLASGHLYPSLYVWMSLTILWCAIPIAVWASDERRAVRRAADSALTTATGRPALAAAPAPVAALASAAALAPAARFALDAPTRRRGATSLADLEWDFARETASRPVVVADKRP